jgi:leader peptidase (prepilin peptidase)/N-methyltransferase
MEAVGMMLENWLWAGFWLVMGTVLGSFFVVVGIRMPVRKSVVRPPSACPQCGNQIRGIDLIPVIGWLWRLSKCRSCKTTISAIYPIMELTTGIGFAALYISRSSYIDWIAGLVLISVLIILTVSDLHYRLLPNRIVYPTLVGVIIYRIAVHPLPIWQYILGFVIGGGLLWLVSWVSIRMNRPAMGGGDIKLMAVLGLLLGVEQVIFIILLSSVLGLFSGILMIVMKRMSLKTFVPFGPFISIAAFVSWLFGDQIVSWYLGFYVLA